MYINSPSVVKIKFLKAFEMGNNKIYVKTGVIKVQRVQKY